MLKNSLCFDERIKQIYTNVALEWEIQQGLTSKIILILVRNFIKNVTFFI